MKVTGWVMTNKVGSKAKFVVEIDDADLAECVSENDRNILIDNAVFEALHNHVEWGWTADAP